jgi:hypothetical protein
MRAYARITVLALTLGVGTGAALADPGAAPSQASQPAKWVSRNVDFTYQGFTSQYSCDGLRSSVVTILRAFGARRKDLQVQITPCAAIGNSEISFSPGVRGTISVLVPATAAEVSSGDPRIVQAHWKTVDLMHSRKLDNEHGGQCELLEQSKRGLLPMFTTRNLDFTSNCIPHQTFSGGMTFKVDVLQADPKA